LENIPRPEKLEVARKIHANLVAHQAAGPAEPAFGVRGAQPEGGERHTRGGHDEGEGDDDRDGEDDDPGRG